MENKEQLEKLIVYIKRLTLLTEKTSEQEIYPVSFFSEAFDITCRMQELLHQMEVSALSLFERQMKVHQTQVRSVGRLSEPQSVVPQPVPPVPQQPPPVGGKPDSRLNEAIERKRLADLKKAFTLNDRFRFCRELFGRDEKRMNSVIADLNEKNSYEESIACLKEQFDWNFEDETVTEFIAILEKRFP